MCNYRPHPEDDGRLYFHFVCQSTPGGGVPDPALDGGEGEGYLIQPWTGGVPYPALDRGGEGGGGQGRGVPDPALDRGGGRGGGYLIQPWMGAGGPGLSKGKNF